MSEQNSYKIDEIATNVDAEIKRLKAQVELFWDKELKHLLEFGLSDGMTIVELGCGPGFVVEKILNRFPNSEVTALEIEPMLVKYSRNYLLKKQFKRFKIIEGSIMNTGMEENFYDIAITRLVLEHLPDPLSAVLEVLRIVKPGGKAIFVDNDFEMHIMTYPHTPALRILYDAYCNARFSEGGNPKIGRELPRVLKQAGFTNIDFEVISAHSEIIGDEMFFKSEGIGIPYKLFRSGFLSSKELANISVEWRNMIKNDNHSIVRQLYMAVGSKKI
ncbi:methyltransferase domain-containing protein [Clostridium estertheticum]|uniref:methyltransferase domain-containing protein n=1 Tax=Clostridium estertheticum TaxID=238834 RepID=UPI001CF348C8|nr:methyltransferase domain-containing protein [Clostridium estertheticum]MCB2360140.1 methyltransferase domain-containing protein [Clostridium estertheticum]